MKLAWITHDSFEDHDTGAGHPERVERIRAVWRLREENPELHRWTAVEAIASEIAPLEGIHSSEYVEKIRSKIPKSGRAQLDPDTVASPGTWQAALHAAGAANQAVEGVLAGTWDRAFCAVRPPGHHAEPNAVLGFCLFNNIAVAARRALELVDRVAIIDFDVHHGNGTERMFENEPRVLFCSSFQHPFYPNRPFARNHPHLLNLPLPEKTGSKKFREAIKSKFWTAIENHKPNLILISAGFDAHRLDPLAGFELDEEDFRWISDELVALANAHCQGRIVSALEGGYHLDALRNSLHQHLSALMT